MLAILAWPGLVTALEVALKLPDGASDTLRTSIKGQSLLFAAKQAGSTEPQDVLAAAQAEYRNILGILYRSAYYGATVSVKLDGAEVAELPPFYIAKDAKSAVLTVTPGKAFVFGRATVSPVAKGTELPAGFATGQRAGSAMIGRAVDAAVLAWRDAGYAKADVAEQRITANHADSVLNADIILASGPKVRFGQMTVAGSETVREARIRAIAGFPQDKVFSPAELERVAARLRKTGTFRSVALTEAKTVSPGDRLDVALTLVDAKPRRFGFGAELSSLEGATVNGYWLHRNIFGGAEQLRFDAEVSGIGGTTGGTDYHFSTTLTRPGTYRPVNTLRLRAAWDLWDEPDYHERRSLLEAAMSREISDRTEVSGGVQLRYSQVKDDLGQRTFTHIAFPITGFRDRRDNILNPTRGSYYSAELMPYLGLDGSASGTRAYLEARGYYSPGETAPVTLAARAQIGSIIGSDSTNTPPDFLFFSGGGGTVRGQPYQSLGVILPGDNRVGGTSYLGFSGEARVKAGKKFSVVAFADAGYVGASAVPGSEGDWHAGAGLGLRYDTGLGPIRLDVAAPVYGATGNGVQLYIGIGQAF